MKKRQIAKRLSWGALALVILPSLLAFFGVTSLQLVKLLALVGTGIWFVATPVWMSQEPRIDDTEVEI